MILRRADMDCHGEIWTAEPEDHKTAHHGHAKTIYFGPKAQEVLQPFLLSRKPDEYLFSPAEAEQAQRARRHAERTTRLSCGNKPGSNRSGSPRRKPGDRYTVDSYRRAIQRACDRAYPPPDELARQKVEQDDGRTRWETNAEWQARLGEEGWKRLKEWRKEHRWHPHQLRHNAATHIRAEFGVETARIILGQKTLSVTEIYAEQNHEKAVEALRKVG